MSFLTTRGKLRDPDSVVLGQSGDLGGVGNALPRVLVVVHERT